MANNSSNSSNNQPEIMYRMPPVKRFHVNQFALSIALLFVFVVMGSLRDRLGFDSNITPEKIINCLLIIAIFTYATIYLRWYVFIITVIIFIYNVVFIHFFNGQIDLNSNLTLSGIFSSILFLASWYFGGYIFGWTFAFLYNFCIHIILRINAQQFGHKNIAFAYRPDVAINILKSPINGEEIQLEPSLESRKINKYNLQTEPNHPYTIAFIANPQFMDENGDIFIDPMIIDLPLFMHSVDRAMKAFEEDEVLGRPEIWSRVRIVTIFTGLLQRNEAHVLSGESSAVYEKYYSVDSGDHGTQAFPTFENVITPVQQNILDFIRDINENNSDNDNDNENFCFTSYLGSTKLRSILNEIDVVYVCTANLEYNRSSAIPCSGREPSHNNIEQFDSAKGDSVQKPEWEWDPNNASTTNDSVTESEIDSVSERDWSDFIPGMVALNVVSARQKTIIHEFGHAMAHDTNGAIVDEYYDMALDPKLMTINRLSRTATRFDIPKDFATYNHIQYFADRDHPSARENWFGFFPLREAKDIGCIMDRSIGRFQFDKLISAFMYDRLISKIW